MDELHARFKGRVQGVGFRWTVLDVAQRHHLKGTVKNLSNGCVEVIAQGDACDAFLKEIQDNPDQATIENIEISYEVAKTLYPDFRIVY